MASVSWSIIVAATAALAAQSLQTSPLQTTSAARSTDRGGPQGPTFPECTGIMAMTSASGSAHGPWTSPQVIYQASNYTAPNGTIIPPPGGAEWYSELGIDNPTMVILPNGSTLLSGRTCSRTEHPWVASASHWSGPFRSIDQNQQPFPQTNVEDPFLWRDKRGHFHMLHHWQSGNRNAYANGGHSFSRDGVRWTFSNATAYTKNISWTATGPNINNTEPWTLMARRERPGMLLDSKWETPLALFSAVAAHTWRRNVLPRWVEAHQSYVVLRVRVPRRTCQQSFQSAGRVIV